MSAPTAGFLRHNLDLFSRSNDVLKYLDRNYDLFYTSTDFKDNKKHIQFELQELQFFEGTNHGYSIDDLGICEVTVNPGNDIYVDWLSVEEKHQRKGIAYFLLYVVSLFAKDNLCYRMLLCDASEQKRLDKHIYKRLCLAHVDYNKHLKYVHSRRSDRLNDEIMMTGNLNEVISRLEGNDPCKIGYVINTLKDPQKFKKNIKTGGEKSKSMVIPLSEEEKNEISRLEQEVDIPEYKRAKKAGSRKKKKRSSRKRISRKHHSRRKHHSKRRHSSRRSKRSSRRRSNRRSRRRTKKQY